jgi:hypothetical protein
VPTPPESFRNRAAQEQPADGGSDHDQWEGNGEEVERDEGQDREGHQDKVVERSLADSQDRLDHDGYDHGLHPVEQTVDRWHVGVGYRQVREQEQDEDRRYYEEGAGHDATKRPVQPPANVGGDLLRLGTGQEHAEVQRPEVLLLGDPALLLDKLPVHDRDLPGRTPEVDEPQLYPEPERLPEPHRLGTRLRVDFFGFHTCFIHLLTEQLGVL